MMTREACALCVVCSGARNTRLASGALDCVVQGTRSKCDLTTKGMIGTRAEKELGMHEQAALSNVGPVVNGSKAWT